MKKFVVIGGTPRSGTNLARRIVGSHSKIAIPPGEFQLFNHLARGKSQKRILGKERLKKWDIDFTPYLELDPKEVYVKVLQTFADKAGKEIPGEKTPFNEFFYDEIKSATQEYDLKFVHLVRNPFDVMASYKHMDALEQHENYDLHGVSVHTRNWQRSVLLGLAHACRDPDHYYLLRYEDLATRPVEESRKLCDFFGLEFEEERMLQFADFSTHKDNTSFAESTGNTHAQYTSIKAPVSRKDHLTSAEIRRICETCGEAARAFGYEDPDFQVQPPEPEVSGILERVKEFTKSRLLQKH